MSHCLLHLILANGDEFAPLCFNLGYATKPTIALHISTYILIFTLTAPYLHLSILSTSPKGKTCQPCWGSNSLP